jgi:hypothetical protein
MPSAAWWLIVQTAGVFGDVTQRWGRSGVGGKPIQVVGNSVFRTVR